MARPPTRPGARGPSAGGQTKARIIDAALETLKREGVVGASARAIAQTGGFNPALIFYHFGTVAEVLAAAVEELSRARVARYGQRLAAVSSLPELVAVASDLHHEDVQEGHVTVLAQMLAGSASSPELGRRLLAVFEPWIDLVEGVLDRVLAGTPYEGLVPTRDAAFAITSLFLGLELLTHLGGDFNRGEQLLETFGFVAGLAESLMGTDAPE